MGRGRGVGRRLAVAFLMSLVVLGAAQLVGCGSGGDSGTVFSSAGVSNGTIVGTVRGAVGGTPSLTPLSGVRVQATRISGGVAVSRTTFTNGSGGYAFFDMPLGTYDLTFSLTGFSSAGGGSLPIRTSVDFGGFAQVADVVLTQGSAIGGGTVNLHLVDDATGFAVPGATVTVGGYPPSFVDGLGNYVFNIPVTGLGPLPILVQAPGLAGTVPFPSTVTPVAGFPVSLTVTLAPTAAYLAGFLQASTLNSLYISNGILGTISITSPQVSQVFLDPIIGGASGEFSVQVPASTVGGSVFVDLTFTSPFFQTQTVSNILAPGTGGTATLSTPVVLQPKTATLVGRVVNSIGIGPTGPPNQVVVVQTGQAATLVGGDYTLVGVPTGIPLTLQATTLVSPNPAQTGSVVVTPVPGTFNVPTIITF